MPLWLLWIGLILIGLSAAYAAHRTTATRGQHAYPLPEIAYWRRQADTNLYVGAAVGFVLGGVFSLLVCLLTLAS